MAEIKLQEGPKSLQINKKQIFLCIKDKKSGDAIIMITIALFL